MIHAGVPRMAAAVESNNPLARLSVAALFRLLIATAIVGICTAVYLLRMHLYPEAGSAGVCEISAVLSCVAVNTSSYSEILGVPVASLGMIWFAMLLAAASTLHTHYSADLLHGVTLWCLAGLATVFYLLWAEWMLGAICLACTLVQTMTVLALLLVHALRAHMRPPAWPGLARLASALRYWLLAALLMGVLAAACSPHFPWGVAGASAPYRRQLVACFNRQHVGLYWYAACSHCIRQRAMFGAEFDAIALSLECAQRPQACPAAAIEATPTWVQFSTSAHVGASDETLAGSIVRRLEGVQELAQLAKWADCAA